MIKVLLLLAGAALVLFFLANRRKARAKAGVKIGFVLFVVFMVRSFLFEPFKIPSGSMIPTLLVGDLILVNKYSYGVRLPVFDTKIIDVGSPQRGDTVVFRYPMDPSVDYIKRVIGVPGDTITVRRGRVFLNGEEAPLRPARR